jgi:hypothetical protein
VRFGVEFSDRVGGGEELNLFEGRPTSKDGPKAQAPPALSRQICAPSALPRYMWFFNFTQTVLSKKSDLYRPFC